MAGSDRSRKAALRIFLLLLFAMVAFMLFAGHPNQDLLVMSMAGRQIFGMGAAAGVLLSLYLLRFSRRSGLLAISRSGLHQSVAFLALALSWSLACFGCVLRAAPLLDGPVSRELASLQRPLFPGSPLWCSYFTTVRTEAGDTGSLCMERIAARSEFIPQLGCVAPDTPATIQVTRTFLGPVGSLLEISDVGNCVKHKE
jgi:hypothetical protein